MSQHSPSNTDAVSRRQVLLADSDPTSAWRNGRALIRAGFEVHSVDDGNRALALLKSREFQLLVTDVALPGLDGLAVLDWVNRNMSEISTIVLTAGASEAAREYCLDRGCVLFLDKESDPSFLVEALRHYCDSLAWLPSSADGKRIVLRTLVEAAADRRGGEIVVRSAEHVGRVFFVSGQLAWAQVSTDEGGLSADLVNKAGLSKLELKEVYAECKLSGGNFAETLVEWGLIDCSSIRTLLLERISRCILEMARWSSAKSMFLPQTRCYKSELLFDLGEILSTMAIADRKTSGDAAANGARRAPAIPIPDSYPPG